MFKSCHRCAQNRDKYTQNNSSVTSLSYSSSPVSSNWNNADEIPRKIRHAYAETKSRKNEKRTGLRIVGQWWTFVVWCPSVAQDVKSIFQFVQGESGEHLAAAARIEWEKTREWVIHFSTSIQIRGWGWTSHYSLTIFFLIYIWIYRRIFRWILTRYFRMKKNIGSSCVSDWRERGWGGKEGGGRGGVEDRGLYRSCGSRWRSGASANLSVRVTVPDG